MTKIARVSSGSPFERAIGFSRAIRVGDRVLVAGTAPVWPDGEVDPDPAMQARRCLEIIGHALDELGASLAEVVLTRVYLVDLGDVEAISRVHGAVFAAHKPVATMIVAGRLLDERWRVEIEVEAYSPQ
ncbi:MAG: RidA family protein [Acidimicrobiales bacterium]